MKLPSVALIGRPNVGKSTLFNAMVGRRRSIVSDIAGTTRDRVLEKVRGEKTQYWLVDTAGLTDHKGDNLEAAMMQQAETAMENADVVLFVLDARAPLTQDDYDLAQKLRKGNKPVICLANKVDDGDQTRTYDLMELGLGMPMVVSGKNFVHIWDLTDAIEAALVEQGLVVPVPEEEEVEFDPDATDTMPEGPLKLALVGRPNVGKSTLYNQLLGDAGKAITSDVSGTTRDTLETRMTTESGEEVVLLDTAGIRRPGKVGRSIEYWASVRTRQAIEEADVCVLVLDSLDGATHHDLTLIGRIIEAGKGLVLCVNKFDLVYEKSRQKDESDERELAEVKMWGKDLNQVRKDYWYYLSQKISFAPWAPVLFLSAKTGKGTGQIVEAAANIYKERYKRVPTAELNRLVPDIQFGHVQPSVGTKTGKIKYLAQVDTAPPKFIFHVNNTEAFHWSYRRYCENKLREKYTFAGTPIQVEFRDAMKEKRRKR